ncbi:MAG: trypsin-like peptidase domain-containing protein [Actinobacteria bacterium]|nr:trypsin-like peptidase domain-containing protein [Actinomycetota bacterium]
MNNIYHDDEHDSIKPVFLKGCGIIIAIIVLLIVGFLFTLGILSVVNKVSPVALLKGVSMQVTQTTKAPEKPGESGAVTTEKPKLEDKKTSGDVSLQGFNDAITKLVEEVTPSVVNIALKVRNQDVTPSVVNIAVKVRNQDGSISEGVGSGVIYSEDGYIITNNHVAGAAQEIIVRTTDGKEHVAKLIGANIDTDIAVIKIDAKNLKKANFTSINNVKVGEIVIAIGSPFAIEQTVTMGVVSAIGREIAVSSDTMPMVDLIQTDTAINPGNSGGPLINIGGQVIGINTLIYSPSGTNAGIGFAIPSDTAINIASQIIKYGKAMIPYIGIEMGQNTTNIPGVLISVVQKGYPADKAGIKAGDILTKFDGEPVRTNFELLAQILRHNVGDSVQIDIYRNGSTINLSVTLVESPVTAQNPTTTTAPNQ